MCVCMYLCVYVIIRDGDSLIYPSKNNRKTVRIVTEERNKKLINRENRVRKRIEKADGFEIVFVFFLSGSSRSNSNRMRMAMNVLCVYVYEW